MPVISVIVPIYNVEEYLKECIDSILRQSFSDFELILVDDGSKDNCPKICDEYASKDCRVIVIHKENGGLSSARNAGLDLANGEYIVFVDGDDYIEDDLLETCLQLMDKYNTESVKFSYLKIGSQKNNNVKECYYNIDSENIVSFVAHTLLSYSIRWESWSWMYSGRVIRNNNLRFADNKYVFAEDIFFSCLYSLYISSLVYTSRQPYHYRVRDNSIMRMTRTIKLNEMNRLSQLLSNHYKDHDDFCLVHHAIVLNQLSMLPKLSSIANVKKWKKEFEKIEDKSYFKKNNREYYLKTKKRGIVSFLSYSSIRDRFIYTWNSFSCCFEVLLRRVLSFLKPHKRIDK